VSTRTAKQRRAIWAKQIVAIPAVVVLFVMTLHVVANALMRTFLRQPIPDTLEVVQFWYLPIIALLGMIAAQQAGQHIAAELIYDKLTPQGKKIYSSVGLVLCMAVSIGFVWFGGLEAIHAAEIGRTSGPTGLPIWPVYFLVPITFGTLAVQFARLLLTGRELAIDVDGAPGDDV